MGGMTDRVLDRVPTPYNPRMEAFRIRQIIAPTARPRTYTWGIDVTLDQGQEGACVGFGWTHEAAARPDVWVVTNDTAFNTYHEAQAFDRAAGNNYASGATVDSGAKAARQNGWLKEYRWAAGPADVVLAIATKGPGVFGLDWWTGMFDVDAQGFVHVTGKVEGGHCILGRGVKIVWGPGTTAAQKTDPDWWNHVDQFQSYVLLHNSWGPTWGRNGDARLAFAEMARLLSDGGEFAVPVVRDKAPKAA
jgi:hypothetical protein